MEKLLTNVETQLDHKWSKKIWRIIIAPITTICSLFYWLTAVLNEFRQACQDLEVETQKMLEEDAKIMSSLTEEEKNSFEAYYAENIEAPEEQERRYAAFCRNKIEGAATTFENQFQNF